MAIASSTPELRLRCPESRKREVVEEVAVRLREAGAEVDLTDGLRVKAGVGWWLLRASAEHLRRNGIDSAALDAQCSAARATVCASGGSSHE
jgi:phosphomannomutase